MKLLQLNIWEGKLLKQVLDFIEQEQPDILCLQEVFSCKGNIKLPDMMFDSLEQIQHRTGYKHTFFSSIFTALYAGVPADFGMAIISRYPLENQQAMFTHGSYNPDQTAENYAPNSRILQLCSITAGSTPFYLANHHGHWEPTPLGSTTTIEKMQLVKTKLQTAPSPLIFTGDLNITPESPAMRVFDDFLEDLTATHQVRDTLSQLGKVPDVPCDHILISSEIQVRDFRVCDELVSDHKALILEFEC